MIEKKDNITPEATSTTEQPKLKAKSPISARLARRSLGAKKGDKVRVKTPNGETRREDQEHQVGTTSADCVNKKRPVIMPGVLILSELGDWREIAGTAERIIVRSSTRRRQGRLLGQGVAAGWAQQRPITRRCVGLRRRLTGGGGGV